MPNIFSTNSTFDDSRIIFIPVPWCTKKEHFFVKDGPIEILKASHKLNFCDPLLKELYECGMYMLSGDEQIYISTTDTLNDIDLKVYAKTKQILNSKKQVGIVGGSQAVITGAIKAISEKYINFGILQLDAHLNMKKSINEYDEDSIFRKIIEYCPTIKKITSVGVRDYSFNEIFYVKSRELLCCEIFFDETLCSAEFNGIPWNTQCFDIVSSLPKHVWISFDIDVLDPSLCPNTSKPVPGGLTYNKAIRILKYLVNYGHTIIGFDLCNVARCDKGLDARVGAKILYELACSLLISNELAEKDDEWLL